jgi:hypothetical protein
MEEYNKPTGQCKTCEHCLWEEDAEQDYDGSWINGSVEYYCKYGYCNKYEKGGTDCKRYKKIGA